MAKNNNRISEFYTHILETEENLSDTLRANLYPIFCSLQDRARKKRIELQRMEKGLGGSRTKAEAKEELQILEKLLNSISPFLDNLRNINEADRTLSSPLWEIYRGLQRLGATRTRRAPR